MGSAQGDVMHVAFVTQADLVIMQSARSIVAISSAEENAAMHV